MGLSVSKGNPIESFIQSIVCPLLLSKPYSWFYDQTHDNPGQIGGRSVEDVLRRPAIVAMMKCSTGSDRGYDELVPRHIDIVHETRLYSKWGYETNEKATIISIKIVLNKFNIDLTQQGFFQVKFLL